MTTELEGTIAPREPDRRTLALNSHMCYRITKNAAPTEAATGSASSHGLAIIGASMRQQAMRCTSVQRRWVDLRFAFAVTYYMSFAIQLRVNL